MATEIFFHLHPETWGKFPIRQIFFRWVGSTTNQIRMTHPFRKGFPIGISWLHGAPQTSFEVRRSTGTCLGSGVFQWSVFFGFPAFFTLLKADGILGLPEMLLSILDVSYRLPTFCLPSKAHKKNKHTHLFYIYFYSFRGFATSYAHHRVTGSRPYPHQQAQRKTRQPRNG